MTLQRSPWTELHGSDHLDQMLDLEARFDRLLDLSAEDRKAQLRELIEQEYALGDQALRAFTLLRLRALLSVAAKNPWGASVLATDYDAVFATQPAAIAMRRVFMVQNIARSDLDADEVECLRQLIPSIMMQVPRTTVLLPAETYLARSQVRRGRWLRALRRAAISVLMLRRRHDAPA